MRVRASLINLAAFQICWFACVMGAAVGVPLLGPALATVWLPLHIRAARPASGVELKLILVAGALGYLLDSALVLAGWLSFPAQAALGGPSTAWMVTLWLGFAATLRHGLAWLRGRYVLGVLLGAVLGPFAYWSGSQLGAVMLGDAPASLLAVSVEWMIAMPLLLLVLDALERSKPGCLSGDSERTVCQESG